MVQQVLSKTNPANNEVVPFNNDCMLTDYLRRLSRYKTLSLQEEQALLKQAKMGDFDARCQILNSHLKLVVMLAKKIVHVSNLPMIDLIQEGNLGLMIAIEKFNPELGYRFATYASWWVKQSIFKAISEQSHSMKIPVYVQETLSKFKKIKLQMEQKYNCEVQIKDVAQKMNIAQDKIDAYLTAFSKSISIESELSLQNGSTVTIADILQDEKASVASSVEYGALKEDIELVVAQLKQREQEVIKMRFGLNEFKRRTLEEIGNLYGVTKECIRQTELRALKKMRLMALSGGTLASYAN